MSVAQHLFHQDDRYLTAAGGAVQHGGHTAHAGVAALIGIAQPGVGAGGIKPQPLGVGRAGVTLDAGDGGVQSAVHDLLLAV